MGRCATTRAAASSFRDSPSTAYTPASVEIIRRESNETRSIRISRVSRLCRKMKEGKDEKTKNRSIRWTVSPCCCTAARRAGELPRVFSLSIFPRFRFFDWDDLERSRGLARVPWLSKTRSIVTRLETRSPTHSVVKTQRSSDAVSRRGLSRVCLLAQKEGAGGGEGSRSRESVCLFFLFFSL